MSKRNAAKQLDRALIPASFSAAETSIRQLIANGNHKTALERAKDIHKSFGTPASEALLLDAYESRIRGLIQQNLTVEANSLLTLVRERYPFAADRLAVITASVNARSGKLEELVRPLTDPALAADRRAAIERAIERDLFDPALLASCEALPVEHPLRQAASAVQRAFSAVTSGPATEEMLALPEISRRSPLASWKMLVWAIAAFYRREDQACQGYLAAIHPDSAPARCVPLLKAMLQGNTTSFYGVAADLASRAVGDAATFQHALERLERALSEDSDEQILCAMRAAVEECRRTFPAQVERFKQHAWVRALVADIPLARVTPALGEVVRTNAYFSRLAARGYELSEDPWKIGLALLGWHDFKELAVTEKWFPDGAPEVAALYVHMAALASRIPAEAIPRIKKTLLGKMPDMDLYHLDPGQLYRRACTLDPQPETFDHWLSWAKTEGGANSESVAETWHKSRPGDIEPVLYLMGAYEARNAFPTALKYLDKAEEIDGVNPKVRRARMRLMARSVVRYIQQRKYDLAERRIAETAALPQAQQGDRPAFLAALRWMVSQQRFGVAEEARSLDMERLLGSRVAAALLMFGIAQECKRYEPLPDLHKLSKEERASMPAAVARVVMLAEDMQFNMRIVGDWMREVEKQFAHSRQSLQIPQLRALGVAALTSSFDRLGYAISSAGLAKDYSAAAEFLLLRARSLSFHYGERRIICAAAAAELARQSRDLDLAGKAVDFLRERKADSGLQLTAEQVAEIVQKEKAEPEYPRAIGCGPDYSSILEEELCDCPACRRERGELPEDSEQLGGELDLDELLGDLPPDMPPEVAMLLFSETAQAVMNGDSLDDLMARLASMGVHIQPGIQRRKGRKGRR